LKQIEEPSIKELKENKPAKIESQILERENDPLLKKTTEFVPKFYFPPSTLSDKTIPEETLVNNTMLIDI